MTIERDQVNAEKATLERANDEMARNFAQDLKEIDELRKHRKQAADPEATESPQGDTVRPPSPLRLQKASSSSPSPYTLGLRLASRSPFSRDVNASDDHVSLPSDEEGDRESVVPPIDSSSEEEIESPTVGKMRQEAKGKAVAAARGAATKKDDVKNVKVKVKAEKKKKPFDDSSESEVQLSPKRKAKAVRSPLILLTIPVVILVVIRRDRLLGIFAVKEEAQGSAREEEA
ncbi:Uu.00g136140.m01.CDS01 [Anthostomella pinea]|uniref:Uu.00g136140.m01.CDS01 n=1 Tax=Anthostomella pinea TaxID=933095 RepID=A0AAI8VPX1_9PEZI|nr:Uu.00g136140.m01.CDS01 [Anthostomella pinea]